VVGCKRAELGQRTRKEDPRLSRKHAGGIVKATAFHPDGIAYPEHSIGQSGQAKGGKHEIIRD
jgi:hypothetical protein